MNLDSNFYFTINHFFSYSFNNQYLVSVFDNYYLSFIFCLNLDINTFVHWGLIVKSQCYSKISIYY